MIIKVRCIKEYHSLLFPDEDYGVLGTVYTVTKRHYYLHKTLRYYQLAELTCGWVNVERFKEIVSDSDTVVINDTIHV